MVDSRFFDAAGEFVFSEILELVAVQAAGFSPTQLQHIVSDAAPLHIAKPHQIALAAKKRYVSRLETTEAGVVIVSPNMAENVPSSAIAVVCENPHLAFVKILEYLFPYSGHHLAHCPNIPHLGKPVFEDNVTIAETAVIGSGVQIGKGTIIGPGAVIAAGVTIGRQTIIADNVTIECALIGDNVLVNSGARVGAKGFGWLDHGKRNHQIPQLGRVIVQSNVEIGANTTIDRGALGDTIIGENTKIGAMVEVGHNSIIGANCLLAPMVGLAGSTILEDGVLMGADSGSAGHLTIGEGSILHARSAASKDWPPGSMLAGAPAMDIKEYWRDQAVLRKLVKGTKK